MYTQHVATCKADTQSIDLLTFKLKLLNHIRYIDKAGIMTKKRFLARMRCDIRLDYDFEFRSFYQLTIETKFISIMRAGDNVTVNF